MGIQKEQYDALKIETLRRHLQTQSDAGQPIHYEIYVDQIRIVPKTNNVELFKQYEKFITEDTQKIKILLFNVPEDDSSYDQLVYTMPLQRGYLNGTEQKQPERTDLQLERELMSKDHSMEREKWKYDLLEKEHNNLKEKLKEAEEYGEQLEAQIKELNNKKLHMGNVNLGELASVIVEGMVRRNPQMLSKLPGGEALAGIIEEDNKKQQSISPAAPVGEVTFQRQSNEKNISEEEQGYIDFVRSLTEQFSGEEIAILNQIIETLRDDRAKLYTVAELLEINTKQNSNR